jgi:hypothetical protein
MINVLLRKNVMLREFRPTGQASLLCTRLRMEVMFPVSRPSFLRKLMCYNATSESNWFWRCEDALHTGALFSHYL